MTDIGPPMATIASNSRQSGRALALVELDPMQLGAALAKDVLEHARRLACDVLEDEDTHRLDPSLFSHAGVPIQTPSRHQAVSSVEALAPYRGRRGGA